MTWRVEIQEQALDDLRRLDPQARRRILKYFRERLESSENPRQLGKPLVGDRSGFWRYRIGDYRAICHLEDQVLTVLVVEIGHRKNIYK
ncbi:MAG: type II toxin-antitoxin system RelE/ParE family toxin [Geoalkalibacter sp.]|jgi:mRNA interferase RelE/StbE|uniref:type II toxin-antitoxin system RelE family toxin n=1 Tax=Geoalkalibacter sp. TaxID=3041440 RepID=UPI003D0B2D1C